MIPRDVRPADLAEILALNEAEVPHVNSLGPADMAWFADHATYFRVMECDGGIGGFLIGLGPGVDYASPNYQWFAARCTNFLYVDRVVVAPRGRGRGVGRRLYGDLADFGRAWVKLLTCEVNRRPPNPGSDAFHAALGFREVGRQDVDGGQKSVALLAKSPPFP